MQTIELLRRATRHLTVKDPDKMEPSQRIELVDALNEAINRFYEVAPDCYRRTTCTELLSAPELVEIGVTGGDFNLASGSFTSAQRGRSILIPGDPIYNEIVAPDQLLRAYRGVTSTQTATVYSDCVTFRDFKVQRIVNRPRIVDTNTELVDAERYHSPDSRDTRWHRGGPGRTLGDPRAFWIDYVGGTIATGTNDAVMLVRLDPVPARELAIEMDIHILAANYGMSAISTPIETPIHASVSADAFQPLMEVALMRSSMWAGSDRVDAALLKAEQVALSRIQNLPILWGPVRRRVRTRPGY